MMSVLSLTEVLRKANEVSGNQLYSYEFVSESASVEAINGMAVATRTDLPRDPTLAAVIVCASYQYHRAYTERLAQWLRWLDRHDVALGAADTGIFLVTRAGVHWNGPLCCHWLTRPALQEEYPEAEISNRFFEYKPKRFSCAGATAGLDLMLHMVGEHHGKGFAARVGSHLIFGTDMHRSESQQSPLADYTSRVDDRSLLRVLQMMEQSGGPKRAIPALANVVGLSHSQLNRLFKRLLGETPARIYQISRLRRAHALMKSTTLSVEIVAYECGFASRSQFTGAFKAEFGIAPSAIRGGYR
ncbi:MULTISPECIES: helix-turn-helix domain-containing protein [unclassified Mesorhizobium]|uniref:GlxA family transcriptional regulator n=1 Tax=unclassified Mesorhizobium TaxID=325217 RepID=UPI00163D6174|nr:MULTISPECIES: helix-turn-helix domain-containing protein [unclassified Mesorhizobium]